VIASKKGPFQKCPIVEIWNYDHSPHKMITV